MNLPDITDGFETTIYRLMDKAIENNNMDIFKTLNSFVNNVLIESIEFRSLKHFGQYIFIHPFYFQSTFEKLKFNQNLNKLYRTCSQSAAVQLKSTIAYSLGFVANDAKTNEARSELNRFYYLSFCSFSRLLYFIVKTKDLKVFLYSLNELDQCSNHAYGDSYELKYQIKDLREEQGVGNDAQLQALLNRYEVVKKFADYKRHVLSGIKYWAYFQFSQDFLNEKELEEFIKQININWQDGEDILNDAIFYRNLPNGYMEWDSWDYIDRPTGQSFTREGPNSWMVFGFLIDLIRGQQVYINVNGLSQKDLESAEYLYDELERQSKVFITDFTKWKNVLKVESKEQLKVLIEKILSDFSEVKHKSLGNRERAIAAVQLSAEKIQLFKNSVGKGWSSQTRIRRIFEKFNNRILVDGDNVKLKLIGQRTFFARAKMAFIDGEYYKNIGDIGSMGSETARWEDNEFFNTILGESVDIIQQSSITSLVESLMDSLNVGGVACTALLMPANFAMTVNDFTKDENFIANIRKSEEKGTPPYLAGHYKKIPVFTFHSPLLTNRIVACDFGTAFSMKYKSNPDWHQSMLHIAVRTLTDEEANTILANNELQWKFREDGVEIPAEDAVTLIKTSVMIEIWSTLKFEIQNKERYRVGILRQS